MIDEFGVKLIRSKSGRLALSSLRQRAPMPIGAIAAALAKAQAELTNPEKSLVRRSNLAVAMKQAGVC
jgi:hypothetical protein